MIDVHSGIRESANVGFKNEKKKEPMDLYTQRHAVY